MITEEKELLVKDLCARLPYGVKAYASEINKNGIITDVNIPYNMVNLTVDNADGKYELVPLFDIKPYLRPMSSMTKEEKEEYDHRLECMFYDAMYDDAFAIDWLNANHFDYRNLIEKGLALEAKEGVYKKN